MEKRTSQAVIEANRINALKSTGPKTREGKEICRLNALKHGFSSKEILIKGENARDLDELRESLCSQLRPVGGLEKFLVNRITAQAWRLRRAVRIERETLDYWFEWDAKRPLRKRSYDDDRISLGEAICRDLIRRRDTCSKVLKYETTIERSLFRALHELQRLQALRRHQTATTPKAIDVEAGV